MRLIWLTVRGNARTKTANANAEALKGNKIIQDRTAVEPTKIAGLRRTEELKLRDVQPKIIVGLSKDKHNKEDNSRLSVSVSKIQDVPLNSVPNSKELLNSVVSNRFAGNSKHDVNSRLIEIIKEDVPNSNAAKMPEDELNSKEPEIAAIK